jgi:hypothetical protein
MQPVVYEVGFGLELDRSNLVEGALSGARSLVAKA